MFLLDIYLLNCLRAIRTKIYRKGLSYNATDKILSSMHLVIYDRYNLQKSLLLGSRLWPGCLPTILKNNCSILLQDVVNLNVTQTLIG